MKQQMQDPIIKSTFIIEVLKKLDNSICRSRGLQIRLGWGIVLTEYVRSEPP